MSDYIPDPDAVFHQWFTRLKGWCHDHGVAKGLSAAEVTEIEGSFAAWAAEYAAHLATQSAAEAQRQSKDTARDSATPLARRLVRKLQGNPALTDADRAAAGLRVRSGARTPSAVPTTRPVVMVDTSQRLRHTIHFKDETTPNARRRPKGMMGVEIWRFLGPNPPADPKECSFVALTTRTPEVVDYGGEHAGQTAHYFVRWVNTRGAKGPWSETASATVGA